MKMFVMADEKNPSTGGIKQKTVRKSAAPYALKDEDDSSRKSQPPPQQPKHEGADKSEASADKPTPPRSNDDHATEAVAAPTEPGPEKQPVYERLLAPKDIHPGDPDANAPPPGRAPRGDSRSFRRLSDETEEFCLIYRSNSFLVTRRGPVGKQGTWDIVEYPSIGAAAHAYALKCSELSGEGFRDLR